MAGVLAPENKWKVLLPLATMFVTNLANTVFLGPATTAVMKERKHQGMFNLRMLNGRCVLNVV